MKDNKYLIFALIFALLNAGAIFFIFGFKTSGDSVGYFDAIRWFGGREAVIDPWIILRPLASLIALPFEFLGVGAGLIVQNVIFYLLSVILIFKIVELVYGDKKQAFLASLFFAAATQVLEVGLAYLTDMGAWFFYLSSIFLTLFYFKNKNAMPAGRQEKLVALNGFIAGLGFLLKENGALGLLFFGLMVLLSKDFSFKKKIVKLVLFGTFFLIPVVMLQIFTYRYFQVTSLDLYIYQVVRFGDAERPIIVALNYLGQLFRVLGILWIFFFIGLWHELKEGNRERLKIFLALLAPSFSFLLWQMGAAGRSVFVFAPLGILLASRGCRNRGAIFLSLLIFAVLVLNYTFVWLNPGVSFVDAVAKFLGI